MTREGTPSAADPSPKQGKKTREVSQGIHQKRGHGRKKRKYEKPPAGKNTEPKRPKTPGVGGEHKEDCGQKRGGEGKKAGPAGHCVKVQQKQTQPLPTLGEPRSGLKSERMDFGTKRLGQKSNKKISCLGGGRTNTKAINGPAEVLNVGKRLDCNPERTWQEKGEKRC